jgi:hypothetical protein
MWQQAVAVGAVSGAIVLAGTAPDHTSIGPATRQSHVVGVGVHNAYDRAKYPYLADALDSGASLIELDVWVFAAAPRWRVNHDAPVSGSDHGQRNNCTHGGLREGNGNQGFDRCLENLRRWHDEHPGHRPITVKVELKAGFNQSAGAGPAEFDALVRSTLGDSVFTPGELRGTHATLDAAAKADNWPIRAAMAGVFVIELIPGTFERGNPFDTLNTDVEYGRWLRDHPTTAQAFPAVLDAQAGDPRVRFAEASIRPCFVFFDGAASSYVDGGIDTAWYDTNHYYLVMTDAYEVIPAIDAATPDANTAAARVRLLAADHASIVSTDWARLPEVLATELTRGPAPG